MKWVHKADLFIACYQLGEASILCCVNRAVEEFNREVTELVNTHDSWSDIYRNPEVFEWLLSNKNSNITELIDTYQGSEMYG